MKKRLDVLLVERGLAESRAQAQALVHGRAACPATRRPGEQVDEDADARRRRAAAASSRAAGEKLAHALDELELDVPRARLRSTSAPPPAASPTACCSAAPRA